MMITASQIPDVLLIEPKVFGDDRGFFFESFNLEKFREQTGLSEINFVQDNHSKSSRNVLRGLHYQLDRPQGKLVRVVAGSIIDVAVDLRRDSPTLGQWVAYELSGENKHQLWVPVGFGHGFAVLSETAEVLYKTTDYYYPAGERSILWNDPDLAIDWQLVGEPLLSPKDQSGKLFKEADLF